MMHYTMEEGLPSNMVYSVYRDSRGFLWIATDKGVARYNGIKFELFTTFDGLPDNEVFLFQEDYEGRLWFGSYNGDLGFYKDGLFHNKTTDSFLNLKTRVPHIYGMYLNSDSSININYLNSSFFLNIKHDKCTSYDIQTPVGKDKVQAIFLKIKIAPDRFKMVSLGKNFIVDTAGKTISESDNLFEAPLTCFRSQNLHYVVDSNFVYADNLLRIRPLPIGFFVRNTIQSYYTDSLNYFYCTTTGLYINDSIRILRECNVTSMTQDVNENYWVSTINNGIYCMKKDFLNTRVFKNVYSGTVKYCYEDKENLFFALQSNSLYSFKGGNPKLLFDYPKFWEKEYKYPADAGYLIMRDGNVYDYHSIYNDNYFRLHDIQSEDKTIIRHDGVFKRLLVPKMFLATKKNLFVKSIMNIVVEDNPILSCENLNKRIYSPDTNDRSRIFGFTIDEDGNLYFSTIKSVYKIQKEKCAVQTQFGNLAFKTMEVHGNYLLGITHNNNFVICNNFSDKISVDSVKAQNCVWFRFFKLDSCHVLISTNNLYRILTLTPSKDVPKYSISTIENPFIPLDAEGISSDGTNCHFFKNGAITSIDIATLLAMLQYL
jgi:Two component regulator propeller